MLTVVVMPCRDEARGLTDACASLGFREGLHPSGSHLVLVDNGSTDGTWEVTTAVRDASAPGSVTCVREPAPGHVPARERGVGAAAALAAERGLDDGGILLVQADADTCYGAGYLAWLTRAATAVGPGHLLEGRSVPPRPGEDRCAAFRALEAAVDDALAPVLSFDDDHDAIVDDKVAAFLLSDFRRWGGHRREYTHAGDEILAETTRLWLGARPLGASRHHVPEATAVTSQRRVLADPALAFATAGFPRDAGWTRAWQGSYAGPRGLGAFVPGHEVSLLRAVVARVAHVTAMFGFLPRHLERTAPGRAKIEAEVEPVWESPGQLLTRAFAWGHEHAPSNARDWVLGGSTGGRT